MELAYLILLQAIYLHIIYKFCNTETKTAFIASILC